MTLCHSLVEKLEGMEVSLSSSENTIDQNWNDISSALYEAAVQTISYKSKNHRDWFDENSETIHDLLKDMHRAVRAHCTELTNPLVKQHQAAKTTSPPVLITSRLSC